MDEITIRISDIRSIADGVITYISPDNTERTIDLERCRKNWVSHVNSSGNYIGSDGKTAVISLDDSRYVGTTNTVFEDPCRIFYEDVHVRLLIGSSDKKDKAALNQLFKKLSEDKYWFFDYT